MIGGLVYLICLKSSNLWRICGHNILALLPPREHNNKKTVVRPTVDSCGVKLLLCLYYSLRVFTLVGRYRELDPVVSCDTVVTHYVFILLRFLLLLLGFLPPPSSPFTTSPCSPHSVPDKTRNKNTERAIKCIISLLLNILTQMCSERILYFSNISKTLSKCSWNKSALVLSSQFNCHTLNVLLLLLLLLLMHWYYVGCILSTVQRRK